jgi:hypothetical protein
LLLTERAGFVIRSRRRSTNLVVTFCQYSPDTWPFDSLDLIKRINPNAPFPSLVKIDHGLPNLLLPYIINHFTVARVPSFTLYYNVYAVRVQ